MRELESQLAWAVHQSERRKKRQRMYQKFECLSLRKQALQDKATVQVNRNGRYSAVYDTANVDPWRIQPLFIHTRYSHCKTYIFFKLKKSKLQQPSWPHFSAFRLTVTYNEKVKQTKKSLQSLNVCNILCMTQFEIECKFGGHSVTKKFKTICKYCWPNQNYGIYFSIFISNTFSMLKFTLFC